MSLKAKQIIPIYMILNGLGSIVPTILIIGFSISLFEKDMSGVSAAHLEPAILLGMGFAGLLGSFCFKCFSSYTIGICTLLFQALILLWLLLLYNDINLRICTVILSILSCIGNIEHANGLSFISGQIAPEDKPCFFSTFQIFLQVFNILAPIVAKSLLAIFGLKALLLLCSTIHILRIFPWALFYYIDLDVQNIKQQTSGILAGLKEIFQNPGLFRITSFRIITHIAIVAYTISLPILVAKIANGNSQVNAQLYSYSLSILHLGFILSGVLGSWILKRKPKLIAWFFKTSPIFIVVATILAFYVMQPLYLQATALLYGIGLYLFRTSFAIIAQALTAKDKLAHVILTGDAVVKSFAYGIGSFIPFWIILPPLWGIAPPFVGCALCSLFSLGMAKPIIKMYFISLYKANRVK